MERIQNPPKLNSRDSEMVCSHCLNRSFKLIVRHEFTAKVGEIVKGVDIYSDNNKWPILLFTECASCGEQYPPGFTVKKEY